MLPNWEGSFPHLLEREQATFLRSGDVPTPLLASQNGRCSFHDVTVRFLGAFFAEKLFPHLLTSSGCLPTPLLASQNGRWLYLIIFHLESMNWGAIGACWGAIKIAFLREYVLICSKSMPLQLGGRGMQKKRSKYGNSGKWPIGSWATGQILTWGKLEDLDTLNTSLGTLNST